MEINNKPISQYLVSLAHNLSLNEKKCLTKIVEILFNDLERGHSCTSLADIIKYIDINKGDLLALFRKSDLVGFYDDASVSKKKSPSSPLSYLESGELLFISKYLHYEMSIAKQITNLKNNHGISLSNLAKESIKHLENQQKLHDLPNIDQLIAIKNTLENKLSIITGGPGTGKTTIIVFLLWLFYKNYGDRVNIKLACPTGKATKRVQESIVNAVKNPLIQIDLLERIEEFVQNADNFVTIHRLLGVKRNSIHFYHDENNLLDIDVLIIDESSMVSLPMFSKLLNAIDCHKIKHVIFLGDKNQLSSVEEGYVFASLVDEESKQETKTTGYDLFSVMYPKTVSTLNTSKRSNNEVGTLANAILRNNKQSVQEILSNNQMISLHNINFDKIINIYTSGVDSSYVSFIDKMSFSVNNNVSNDILSNLYKDFYQAFSKKTILSSTNIGPCGTNNLNYLIEKKLKEILHTSDEWYTGRPILILENSYTHDLSNGDIGFCIKQGDNVIIVFGNGVELIPEALPLYNLAYALTIHKSQGSEYDNINIVLNDKTEASSTLLTRELIYTAVTRAKRSVAIFGTEDVLLKCISTSTKRNSGLKWLI